MLFHVVNERHRRHGSMIFTTNKALKAWARIFHDEDPGQAIIDRVLERGRLMRLDGPSVRTLHLKLDEALKDDSDQDDEVARISGIKWPEFPEPTLGVFTYRRNIGQDHNRVRDALYDLSHDRIAALRQVNPFRR